MRRGDSCEVTPRSGEEQRRIEDHPQGLIEDKYAEQAAPVAAAPVKKSSGWLAWCLAAIAGLLLLGGIIYMVNRDDGYQTTGTKVAKVVTRPAAAKATADVVKSNAMASVSTVGAAMAGPVDYVYYFPNDVSKVTPSKMLDNVAAKVENANADVVITAYASGVGNAAYNKNLSTQRAEHIANYLVAQGVPRSHVKIVSQGESQKYGDDAHNRRANIHIAYNS